MENNAHDINRFLEAQDTTYLYALMEINLGKKQEHWMWFIFPQLRSLGFSDKAKFYGLESRDETLVYWGNTLLRERMMKICKMLLSHKDKNIIDIMGEIDAMKLSSCMTLFYSSTQEDIFLNVLDTFFDGKHCEQTIELLK